MESLRFLTEGIYIILGYTQPYRLHMTHDSDPPPLRVTIVVISAATSFIEMTNLGTEHDGRYPNIPRCLLPPDRILLTWTSANSSPISVCHDGIRSTLLDKVYSLLRGTMYWTSTHRSYTSSLLDQTCRPYSSSSLEAPSKLDPNIAAPALWPTRPTTLSRRLHRQHYLTPVIPLHPINRIIQHRFTRRWTILL